MTIIVLCLLPFFTHAQQGDREKKISELDKQINTLQRKRELYRKKIVALTDSATLINNKIEALKKEKAHLQAPAMVEEPPPPAPMMVPEDAADRVFYKVEIEARFKGGTDSLLARLNRYYAGKKLPQDEVHFMLQLLISDEGKPRSCSLLKESKSGIYRQMGLGDFMLGTQWHPAIQNGRNVNAYHHLALILRNGVFVPRVPEKE